MNFAKFQQLVEHRTGFRTMENPTASGTLELHEHNCPYATVVAENPEACSAMHTILAGAIPGASVAHRDSLATGDDHCTFEISLL